MSIREVDLARTDLEPFRRELTGYCYRMLGSGFEAEDAVQETMLRAWRNADFFEGRSSVRSWLYRIATNVCIDMQRNVQRRARPMEMGPSSPPIESNLGPLHPEATWVTPIPDRRVAPEGADPADVVQYRESIRLAFVTALQHLPARQRAALILCEVLRWQVSEAAELLDTSVPAINSALQRARSTLRSLPAEDRSEPLDDVDSELLARYVDAFERYDIDRLVTLLREDAVQSMPPFAMWLQGRGRHRALHGRARAEPVPRLAPAGHLGQRLPGLRAVQARSPRRVHAVGPAGPGDLRRRDHRDAASSSPSSTPSGSSPPSASPAPRRLARPARAATRMAGLTSERTMRPPSRRPAVPSGRRRPRRRGRACPGSSQLVAGRRAVRPATTILTRHHRVKTTRTRTARCSAAGSSAAAER